MWNLPFNSANYSWIGFETNAGIRYRDSSPWPWWRGRAGLLRLLRGPKTSLKLGRFQWESSKIVRDERSVWIRERRPVILLSSSSQKWRILQIYFLLENILVQCLLSNSTKIRPPPDIFKNIPKSPPLPYPSISKVCACLGFFNIQLNTYISCIKVWDIQIFQDLVICPKEDPYHEVGGGEFEGMSEVE